MRRAPRLDGNHHEIADYLRNLGWSVVSTAGLGNGFPDLIVGRPGYSCLIEVKDGSLPPSARKLTLDEKRFAERWTGPYIVATSPQEAGAQLLALWRKWVKA